MCIRDRSLGKWVKKAREQGGAPTKALTENEREELERLRKENAQLLMELSFAKKVATWFAKEKQ